MDNPAESQSDSQILPEIADKLPKEVSKECAAHKGDCKTCMSDKTLSKLKENHNVIENDSKKIVEKLKEELHCDSEKCVLTKSVSLLGRSVVEDELVNYKIAGPCDNSLLSNVDIDNILQQWSKVFKGFYPYNFCMSNYEQFSFRDGKVINQPDSLSTVKLYELHAKGYSCAACVINSDKYQGPGKHWMALFFDFRGQHEWSVEFFNSSGRPPALEWVKCLINKQNELESIVSINSKFDVNIKNIKSNIQHQYSKSECGVYSLFYIWLRLNKVKAETIMSNPIPDKIMFEFRQHLFADEVKGNIGTDSDNKFDWEKYKKEVNVIWTSERL